MGYIYTKSGKLAKRLYFGAVLLFEGLYYTFKNRVLADGGTFVENELPTISQDAKLVLTPNAYKAGNLYSAVPNDGTGDFIVERNSTATYIDEDGLIKTALANVPRIDWSTGNAVILRELQGINLIPYSNNFIIAWANKNLLTIDNTEILDPDGNNTASLFNASDSASYVYETFSVIAETTYTFSFYVKQGASTGNKFGIYDNSNSAFINQNIPYNTTSEWVRVTNTFTTPIGCISIRAYILRNLTTPGTFSVFGAQLEKASTVSSYIPTNGTTVTRLADNISVPTPAGVTSITETIDGVEQTPITTIPTTYSLPVGNINKVTML